MWRSNELEELLTRYNNCEYVDEIILIDNAPNDKPDYIKKFNKINYYTTGENNFVNPSWNIGVNKSKNDVVCISNDDILYDVDKTFKYVSDNIHQLGVFGCDYDSLNNSNSESNLKLVDPVKERYIGRHWGCLMFVKKSNWLNIADEIKIWKGCNWIAEYNKNECYALNIEGGLFTEKSATSKDFRKISSSDTKYFKLYKDKIPTMKRSVNIHFSNRGFKDYTLIYIAEGTTRYTFTTEEDDNIIIKKLKFDRNIHNSYNSNMLEYDFYHKIIKDTEYEYLFLEPLDISIDGNYIIFNKVHTFENKKEFEVHKDYIEERFPEEYKKIIRDFRLFENWGYIDGDIKIIDFGHYLLDNVLDGDYKIEIFTYNDNHHKNGYTNFQERNRMNIIIEQKLKARRELKEYIERKYNK